MSASHPWEHYELLPSFVLGFHGCDRSVGEAILHGKNVHLTASKNEYDWLGHGIYFWEGNPQRALDFASERSQGGKNSKGAIKRPFVLGAVIDLGRCLNLLEASALRQLEGAYEVLKASAEHIQLPTNSMDLRIRKLDCAVIETLHQARQTLGFEEYDSVRGAFWEGNELYPNAGFKSKNHIQICVRKPSAIKGYFRPILAT